VPKVVSAWARSRSVGDVAFSKPSLRGLRSVDSDVELGIVGPLLDAQVGNAPDMAQFGEHLVGDAAVSIDVWTVDLDINWCGQAKVQRLGNNVRWQEIERGSRKLAGQFFTQGTYIVCSPVVPISQRYEHVCVGSPGEARLVVDVVDGAEQPSSATSDLLPWMS